MKPPAKTTRSPRGGFTRLCRGAVVVPVLGVLALWFSATGCSARERPPTLEDLPKDVWAALDRAAQTYPVPLRRAEWSEVVSTTGTQSVYQVRGKNGRGNTIEIEINRAGRVIEVEEQGIPLEEVPIVVAAVLNSRVPHFQLKRVEAIYQSLNPKPVAYGFEGVDAEGKEFELYLSADGKHFLN